MIHTIGDSHSNSGWNGITNHNLGPLLCYSFGIEKLNRCDIRNFNIQSGDTIIFCLGEIDCRCHIYKYITETKSFQDIIDEIIINYVDAVILNIKISNLQFKHVCLYNVVPTIQKHNTYEYPHHPFLGSDEERKQIVLYFNKRLKEECLKNNFIFFDIYNHYTDENGFLRKDLSDDNVHIRDGTYITNFIHDFLI